MTTEPETLLYQAQIILQLPGEKQLATVVITLAPSDTIPVDSTYKPLADCTLAELRIYANTLENDVWDTYDSVTLLDLDDHEDVDIDVTLLEESGRLGEELEGWREYVVLLSSPDDDGSSDSAATPDSEPSESADATEPKKTGAKKGAVTPAARKKQQKKSTRKKSSPTAASKRDIDEIAGSIAIPKLVAEDDSTPLDDLGELEIPQTPPVVDSQARVRLAGKRLPYRTRTTAAVDILMDEPSLRAMEIHALSSMNREVAGVLIGPRPEKQPDGRYVVHVIDSLAAKYTLMQGASVTYTADSWRYLNDTLAERYPDESAVMVGWYHTHPGFGIFLSGMDLFIHQNFFTQIWHIAYVLDPRARTSGFFCWNREKTKVDRYDFVWPEWAPDTW